MHTLNCLESNFDIHGASWDLNRPVEANFDCRRFACPVGKLPQSGFAGICYPFRQKLPGL